MNDKNTTRKGLTAKEKMAMTAGAVTALGGAAAEADIVYVDSSPIFQSSYNGDGSATNWDVDGDGGADFQLWVRSSTFFSSSFTGNGFRYSQNFYGIVNFASGQGRFGTALNGQGLVGMGQLGRANALFNSFVVGPTLAGGYQWGNPGYRSAARVDTFSRRTVNYNSTFITTTPSGGGFTTFVTTSTSSGFQNSGPGIGFQNFVDGALNFLGFRFEDANGELHYGWAEIAIFGGDLAITRWAYESIAGRGIHVGSIASVPEPGSLALLGLGAAGLMSLRARRQKRKSAVAD